MKYFYGIILTIALSASAVAQEFRAPSSTRDLDLVVAQPRSEGAMQVGARMGNPAHMLNPAAPLEYGSGTGFVAYEEHDPFVHGAGRNPRPVGLRLFAFAW